MVERPHLTRYVSQDVTLLGDLRRPGGVTLAFSERTGGCSLPPYASLNVGDACGDEEGSVEANRRHLLGALDIEHLMDRLVNPRQVHGSELVVITDGSDAALARAQAQAREGADGVVCTVPDVPVLLCSADCMLVVLVVPGAFAVVHSGWRGTIAGIAGKALDALLKLTGCTASEALCYVGPHIRATDFEVSADLAQRFVAAFGPQVAPDATHVDLGCALRTTLTQAGMHEEAILDECPSTITSTDRFFSYRAADGVCGRQGALAVLSATASLGGEVS